MSKRRRLPSWLLTVERCVHFHWMLNYLHRVRWFPKYANDLEEVGPKISPDVSSIFQWNRLKSMGLFFWGILRFYMEVIPRRDASLLNSLWLQTKRQKKLSCFSVSIHRTLFEEKFHPSMSISFDWVSRWSRESRYVNLQVPKGNLYPSRCRNVFLAPCSAYSLNRRIWSAKASHFLINLSDWLFRVSQWKRKHPVSNERDDLIISRRLSLFFSSRSSSCSLCLCLIQSISFVSFFVLKNRSTIVLNDRILDMSWIFWARDSLVKHLHRAKRDTRGCMRP